MSNWAMGWAQRQRLGDPVAKAVLQTMCYVMRDEQLLVYVSVPTLCEYTEYDERTVRKAIQRLHETGVLLDTGGKKNNVTVWRVPGFEGWLARQAASPDNNGRASETDQRALAQVMEFMKKKTAVNPQPAKPPQIGEGSSQAPTHLQPSPPICAGEAPPNVSPNLTSGDLSIDPSAPAREIPSGSAAAQEPKAKGPPPPGTLPYDEVNRRRFWTSCATNSVTRACPLLDIIPNRVERFDQLPPKVRLIMADKIRTFVEKCLDWECPPAEKRFSVILAWLEQEIATELSQFKPPTPAERATSAYA